MIAKLERIRNTAMQNKCLILNPHKQREQQQTMNKISRTTALERTAADSTWGRGLNYFFLAKSSP